jgi:hypothetical protein
MLMIIDVPVHMIKKPTCISNYDICKILSKAKPIAKVTNSPILQKAMNYYKTDDVALYVTSKGK